MFTLPQISTMIAATEVAAVTPQTLEAFIKQPAVLYPSLLVLISVVSLLLGMLLAQMLRMPGYGWKIGVIGIAILGSIATIFFGWPPKLGVDLKGGYIMIWKIDAEKQRERAEAAGTSAGADIGGLISALKRRLNPDGLKEISIRKYGSSEVEIIIPETDPAEIAKIKDQILAQGFLEFLIVADVRNDVDLFEQARLQAAKPETRRLRLVKNGDGINIGKWVKIGQDDDKKSGIKKLRISGNWSDYLLRNGANGELVDGAEIPNDDVAALGFLKQRGMVNAKGMASLEVLSKMTQSQKVTGADLATNGIGKSRDESMYPQVNFAFRGEGASRMGLLTSSNINRQLAIVLDDTLLSAANIQSQITSSGRITGRFTDSEVDFVVSILRAGSLPATLQEQPVSEEPCDPTLGAENIKQGFQAVWISVAAVFLFVMMYYRFAGFVACFALTLNIALTVALMILFSATLTLPGLAGLVLTVGMSVDSNVLIFERLREELAKGASLRMAIRNGFERAMATILDSNITTLLTAAILYVIGTDQLVGFAVTLILGIVTSMFTAIFCSRVIFDIAERTGYARSLSMTTLFENMNFDFVKHQWKFISFSVIFIVAGLIATFMRGGGILDIDLRGGTSVQISLKEPLSAEELRPLLDEAFKAKTYKGSRVDYTLKPVGDATDTAGRRTTFRVDSIYPEYDEVQDWLTKTLVNDKKESLLKRYRLDFTAVTSPDDKQGAIQPDESTFFTSFQDADGKATEKTDTEKTAVETKAEDTKAEEKTETKAAETKTEPAKTEEKTAPKTEATAEKAADTKDPLNLVDDKKPAATAPQAVTFVSSTLSFKNNSGTDEKIDYNAVKTRLENAAKSLGIDTLQTNIYHDKWDQDPTSRLTEWNVELSTSQNEAQQIMQAMQKDMNESLVWASSKKIGEQIAGDFTRIAIIAIGASLLVIIGYIWVRFQNVQWGFAAVLALVHDVLCMLAAIALSYWLADALGMLGVIEFKIDLTIVAAFLALIGYSINDTIVVFDRMREVKGKMPNITKQVVNDSINQTLSRTFLTFFTTFMVVVVLYAFGGSGIHGFAFAMLVGTVVGCYSSIYIAAPFLLWMVEDVKPVSKKDLRKTADVN
jgi:SecD/SecF fusion protein